MGFVVAVAVALLGGFVTGAVHFNCVAVGRAEGLAATDAGGAVSTTDGELVAGGTTTARSCAATAVPVPAAWGAGVRLRITTAARLAPTPSRKSATKKTTTTEGFFLRDGTAAVVSTGTAVGSDGRDGLAGGTPRSGWV